MDELLDNILKDIRPDLDFNNADKLIDDDILDSFDIITIVSEINEAYSIEISVADLTSENFNSIKSMWELINKLKN